MFKNLTNFNLKRNITQAVGFYIAYVFLGILLSALIGVVSTDLFADDSKSIYDLSLKTGSLVSVIYSLVMYYTIYIKKKMESFIYIVLGIIASIISLFVGIISSFILIAFLTTRDDKTNIGYLE